MSPACPVLNLEGIRAIVGCKDGEPLVIGCERLVAERDGLRAMYDDRRERLGKAETERDTLRAAIRAHWDSYGGPGAGVIDTATPADLELWRHA